MTVILTQPLEEIAASLPAEIEELEPEEVETALKHLQNMDPTGVGARNLAECLALQLRALPPDTPARDAAIRLTTLSRSAGRTRFRQAEENARHRRPDAARGAQP